MPDRDLIFATSRKLRNVGGDGCIQAELSALDQKHDRRSRRQHFCERGRVEYGVLGHRLSLGDERAVTIGFMIRGPAVLQPKDPSRTFVLLDGLSDRLIHLQQFLLIEGRLKILLWWNWHAATSCSEDA